MPGSHLDDGSVFVDHSYLQLAALTDVASALLHLLSMHRLLIVDDEDSIRFSLSAYFETQGFATDCADNLQQVEGLLANGPYTVAISDLRLDGRQNMGGLEVINLIHERHPDTLIVVLSAYRATEVESEAAERGIAAYLRKPKPLPDLAQIIFGLLEEGGRLPLVEAT